MPATTITMITVSTRVPRIGQKRPRTSAGDRRTAAITGAYVALADAVTWLQSAGSVSGNPLTGHVAAISVGIVAGQPVLDLDYPEDSTAETDMNVVMTGSGGIVEVQGTAEGAPFSRDEFNALFGLAENAVSDLVTMQKQAIGG